MTTAPFLKSVGCSIGFWGVVLQSSSVWFRLSGREPHPSEARPRTISTAKGALEPTAHLMLTMLSDSCARPDLPMPRGELPRIV